MDKRVMRDPLPTKGTEKHMPIQIPVRLDQEIMEELRSRAQLEGKSMNQIIREALETHFTTKPVPRDKLAASIERVAKRDANILEALKKI